MDSSEVARIVASGMTVSDKIRALDAGGLSRAEIARRLGKRYQHVRNVLEADRARDAGAAAPRGVAEDAPPLRASEASRSAPDVESRGGGLYRLVVRADGSVLLPPNVRDAFEVAGGGVVMAKLEGDEFKLISSTTGVRRAQEIVRRYIPGDVSLVDELIAERRREAEREERE
jgi:hypothetical protein